jgi:hypothetical protein
MSLDVSCTVLSLTVGLVDRFPVDLGASFAGATAVRINVIDVHDHSAIGHVDGPRGI